MPCNRCGAELKREDIICQGCGARRLPRARVPGAARNSGAYAVASSGSRRVTGYAGVRVRAKRGFDLADGALPRPPVQTASAASPLTARTKAPSTPLPAASAEARLAAATRPADSSPSAPAAPPSAAPRPREAAPARAQAGPPAPPVQSPEPRRLPTQHTASRQPGRIAPQPERRIEPRLDSKPAPRLPPHPQPVAATPPKAEPRPVRRPAASPAAAPARTPVRKPQPARQPLHPLREADAAHSGNGLATAMVIAGLAFGMGLTWWTATRQPGSTVASRPAPAVAAAASAGPARSEPPRQVAAASRPAQPAQTAAFQPVTPPATPAAAQPEIAEAIEAAEDPATDQSEAAIEESTSEESGVAEAAPAEAPVLPKAERRLARKRTAPVARKDRNEEIDRVRAQAFAETRKDRVGRINRPRDAGKLPIAARGQQGELSRAYARCDSNSNILRREQCRWRVCDGKWGRQGCPSYQTQRGFPIERPV